ncbi:MAG: DUF4831 family protein [Bacteroidales bacterium]|nr:DUF4831 family protein [Bacteroidales bacterium]
MRNIIFYLGALFLVFGCTNKINISVSNARKMEDVKGVSFFYSLPRTHLQFHIYVEKTTLVRGPYADWAKEYLGIDKVIEQDEVIWQIRQVDLTTYQDNDPNELYGAKVSGNTSQLIALLSLSGQGLIADISPVSYIAGYSNIDKLDKESNIPDFKDVSVKRNFYEEKDTIYKTLFVDTAFIKVPVIKSYLEKKTDQEKAREAANFIIKTRKRRFKLIAGQYDAMPEGKAMEVSVEELNKIEEEYLSLFIGKELKDNSCYIIDFIPEERVELKQDILCKFSKTEGILPATSKLGNPVNVITRLDIDPNIDKLFNGLDEGAANKGLIYRVPAQVEVSLTLERNNLFNGTVLISQFGQKMLMPASLLKK